jgi:transposase
MRRFGTSTQELVGLRQWLLSEGCTHVAMDSTGVYWKPIYAIMEGALEIVVANAQHIKKVPGRKTDVKDAEWIAQTCSATGYSVPASFRLSPSANSAT